ncbi:hypothetical protein N7512_000685 [Penicillium capsulatum]|nr:hypothetical protein N7512_000685 [Penicillium capsulatum]
MIPDVLDIECHHIPDDQLRYDEMFSMFIISSMPGNYQTCASLKNVRRVQASRDIEGRSRSPRHISGLMIEYHDHPTPNVLGQGVDQLDDAFEISLGEEILSLSIWLAPVGFSVECRDIEIGQAAAIHIETTHARGVTFRSPDFHAFPDDILNHRYQRQRGEKLMYAVTASEQWFLPIQTSPLQA